MYSLKIGQNQMYYFRISTFFAYSLELPENRAYSLHISQIHEADFCTHFTLDRAKASVMHSL